MFQAVVLPQAITLQSLGAVFRFVTVKILPQSPNSLLLYSHSKKTKKMIEVFYDGSCRKNPNGPIGFGYHINYDGVEIHSDFGGDIAREGNTNNVAEYRALILALHQLKTLSGKTIIVRGDNEMTVKQMRGEYKIKKGAYVNDAKIAKALLFEVQQNNSISFQWIPREKNERADELSNEYYSK